MPSLTELGGDLALKQIVIDEFSAEVEAVQPYQVYGLPDLTEHINHGGFYSRPSLRLAAGMFLDRTVLRSQTGEKPQSFGFEVQTVNRLGREDSHNHVFFGKLTAKAGESERPAELQVAVKPARNREALLGELAMFQYLRSLSIPTYEPTGFLVTDNVVRDHLLTRFQGPIATLDNVEWRDLEHEERWTQFSYAIDTAAMLNSQLLFHGDLEGRNIAWDDVGDTFVVDPELMVSALEVADIAIETTDEQERQRAITVLKQKMSHEFTNTCKSVEEYIFANAVDEQRPRTEIAKFKEYNKRLFKPYREALIERDSDHLSVLLDVYDLMVRDKKHRARENSPHA